MRRLFFGIALVAGMLWLWGWDAVIVAAPTPPVATDTDTAVKLELLQRRLEELERKEQKVQDVRETDQRQFQEIRERDRKDTEIRLREFEGKVKQDVKQEVEKETQKAKKWVEYGNKKVEWWLIVAGIAVSLSGIFGIVFTLITYCMMRDSKKYSHESKNDFNEIKIIRNDAEKLRSEIIEIRNSLMKPVSNYSFDDNIDKTTILSARIAASQNDDKYVKYVGEAIIASNNNNFESALNAWKRAERIKKTALVSYGIGLNKYRIALKETDEELKRNLLDYSIQQFKNVIITDKTKELFAYNQWGNSLIELSKIEKDKSIQISIINDAIDKFSRAIRHIPDEPAPYNNYGNAILRLLKIDYPENTIEKAKYINSAKTMFSKAEKLSKGSGAYNLACAAILEQDYCNAKDCLDKAIHGSFPPTCDKLRTDTDLDPVRNEQWFKDFLAEVCLEDEAKTSDGSLDDTSPADGGNGASDS